MRQRRRFHRLTIFLSTTLIGALTVATAPPAHATEAEPLLWEGVVRAADGRPAPAEVVAYVRPPAVTMEEGNALVPLARTTTASDGRFVLRAAPDEAVRAAQDEAGWVTVMVFASGPDGLSVAVDSVAWEPDGRSTFAADDGQRGRWVTSPSERFGDRRGRFSTREASGAAPAPTSERPDVMVLSRDSEQPEAIRTYATPPPIHMCSGPTKSEDLGRSPVTVGELHLNSDWGGQFNYFTTKTTSFQVGFSHSSGWGVAGSTSFSTSGESRNPVRPHPSIRFVQWNADMLFKRFTWRCHRAETWHEIHTVEPVAWTGDMAPRSAHKTPLCNLEYHARVGGGSDFIRKDTSSITLEGAINVHGFSGSITSAVKEGVYYKWHNGRTYIRRLCGSTDYITGHTRVASAA